MESSIRNNVASQEDFVLCVILLLPLLFVVFKLISFPSSKKPPIPPGPKPWPILGNLLQIGKNAHISITHFAQTYGPLISLRLGGRLLVVASSPAAAAAVLKTQDRLLSNRYVFHMTPDLAQHHECSLVFSPECNDHWRSLRSICKANLFTAKAIKSQASLRRRKMNEMIEFLLSKQGSVVEIRDFVLTTVFNALSNFIFSRDLIDFDGEGFNGLKQSFNNLKNLGLAPNLGDFYPFLRNLDVQGLRNKCSIYSKQINSTLDIIINQRRKLASTDPSAPQDFLDVMIQSQFTNDHINYLVVELLLAGTDTSTITVEWTMAELLKNKNIIEKVREEVNTEMKQNSIDESEIYKLKYLWKCVKETLRLHPPAPFLLPRIAPIDCELMGYSIPKESLIFVNVWGIGRDPSIWEESLSFNPMRFSDCDHVDLKGNDFGYLPFGGGRRICPGFPMATVLLPLILANLIHNFEWSLPNGDEDFSKMDMEGMLGVTLLKKQPLKLIPKKRF